MASGLLEVFDPDAGELAPTILYRPVSGAAKWCVRAAGDPRTVVRTIRFKSTERRMLGIS